MLPFDPCRFQFSLSLSLIYVKYPYIHVMFSHILMFCYGYYIRLTAKDWSVQYRMKIP